jgi:hypothetical protein
MNSFWILKCTSKVWESTHACVVKYIRAWLPSQAPRGGLASQTHTCMGTFRQRDHTTQHYKALHHQNVDQTLFELKLFCSLICSRELPAYLCWLRQWTTGGLFNPHSSSNRYHWRSPNSTQSHGSRRHFSTNALHYRHLLRHIHGAGSSTWSEQAYLITDGNIWQHDSHALFTQRFYGLKTGFNESKKITTPIVLIKQFVVKGIWSHISTNSRSTISF